ncbi:MAG: exodeoxyribonuclease VII large subunit [Ruminococcaceae bacterium]|nr:exodeoxyribonuclease VII large subunit [Oscillospiraceae bacterium]
MAETAIVTVSQLNAYLKRVLENQSVLGDIWIKGEISNYKKHFASGHLYITLKDEGGVLKAVMFRSAAQGLTFEPEDGMKVLARGRVSVYEAGGSYQLYIQEMTPDGVGALYIAYEQLKKKLEAEGLFSDTYKKPIPEFPERVGVITATTGAAIRDIIHVITRRYPLAKIVIYPSLVQGSGAAENIAAGIEYMNRHKLADTLIVGRGGGSIEDLWAFNEEVVARAIFASEIPIISAVGHETDFTIADFVADLRAPTPSAAAELAVPQRLELISQVGSLEHRLKKAMLGEIASRKLVLERFSLRTPQDLIEDLQLRLDADTKAMQQALLQEIQKGRYQLSELCAKLDALSPLQVMARGYAIALDAEGNVIRSAKDLKKDDTFDLKLKDGTKQCVVK